MTAKSEVDFFVRRCCKELFATAFALVNAETGDRKCMQLSIVTYFRFVRYPATGNGNLTTNGTSSWIWLHFGLC